MKRLTFLLSGFRDGGIETVLLEYLSYLAQDPRYQITLAIAVYLGKYEVYRERIPAGVRVVYLVDSPALTHVPLKRITREASPLMKLADQLLVNPLRRYQIQRGIRRLEATTDIFIDFDTCAYTFLRAVRKPKVAFFHFSFEQARRQNPRRMVRIGRALEQYARVVCISEAMAQEGRTLFPDRSASFTVIYNGKDPARLQTLATVDPEDERLRQPYLLAIERLEESQKDLTTLLHAYAQLRADYGLQEQLYLIGQGASEGDLRALVRRLGLEDAVHFLGFIANPYPWIKHARMLVHSAKFEGLPTVLIEALLLGKDIVSSDCPTGPREILADGRAGLLVPVGDAHAFAMEVHRLLTDRTLQGQLQAGRVSHQERFTMHACGEQLKHLLDEVS